MNDHTLASPRRRRLLCGCAGLAGLGTLALGGCSPAANTGGGDAPLAIGAQTSCSLDGMLLADFPGPKGQVHYQQDRQVDWFCDTVELLSALIAPEQVRAIKGAWVQDMARADWERPQGHWIDARQAWYVLGSRRKGSMGPTAASFASAADALAFVQAHGGQAHRFAEITPTMVDLTGGALHDTRM
jgi:copper chaperone NosL